MALHARYRTAALGLLAVVAVMFFDVLFLGRVVFPNDNRIESGASAEAAPSEPRVGMGTELGTVLVPETHAQLNGDSTRWLAQWSPHDQLGRPMSQVGATSKAFLPTYVLSFLTNDAITVATIQIVLAQGLAGLFLFLFLRELQLDPLACFVGGAALTSAFFFSAGIAHVPTAGYSACWAAGLLWLLARFLDRPSFGSGFGAAFTAYALLLTGHPSYAVITAWYLGMFFVVRVVFGGAVRRRIAVGGALFAASVLCGAIAAAPVLLDLLEQARRSTWFSAAPDLALAWYPLVYTPAELLGRLTNWFDPFWFGAPQFSPVYPIPEIGLGPLLVTLAVMSIAVPRWREILPWLGIAVFCSVASLFPTVYLFGAGYLGLGMAPFPPLALVVLPAAVLAAYAVDHVATSPRRRGALIVLALLPLLLTALVRAGVPLAVFKLEYVLLSVLIVAGVLVYVIGRRPIVAIAVVVASVLFHTRALVPVHTRGDIARSSTLTDLIARYTAGGYRYAAVGPKGRLWLPPNDEDWYGIRSIHSNDSLSSRQYQRMLLDISDEGAFSYGRWFPQITSPSRIGGDAFSFTGVNLIVASAPAMNAYQWQPVAVVNGVHLFLRPQAVPLEIQADTFTVNDDGAARVDTKFQAAAKYPVMRTANHDDRIELTVTAAPRETLLVLSMQHHPRWKARSGATELKTVAVNDFYLGVRIPAGTTSVVLSYESLVLWSWIPHLAFLLFGVAIAGRRITAGRQAAARPGEAP
jgi:hypothetical protein